MPDRIISFGFRHHSPHEPGALILDVRLLFARNPYRHRSLRALRGDHPDVERDILQTPGFEESYRQLKDQVAAFPGTVYLGCTGGHHRSVYLVNRLGTELAVPVEHLNYHDR